MIPFSVLDLSPITKGSDAGRSLRNTLDLAQHAERWGYQRYWLAEHHSMPGIASAATSVVICHVASGTHSIRVGAGGIMLPNHSPLVIAEQFGTLEALFPGRIDLGLGRAPGSDQAAARALRRNLATNPDEFPQDVIELLHYFAPTNGEQRVMAVPGVGLKVPLWILGSSLFGAQVAAALGLPFAFASHFAPAMMMQAIEIYRSRFRPSTQLDRPYVMLGFNIFAADSDAQAQFLATSMKQAFVNLRSGNPTQLPPPLEGYENQLPPAATAMLAEVLSCSAIGSP
jgi:luciferase family oxidoreductase group 1